MQIKNKAQFKGFAVALAWPETYCKQPGACYDGLMNRFGIAKNNFYKVGHAAVLLVNKSRKKCFYFDFGRYHSTFGKGRVRSAETDHDLAFNTKPIFSKD